MTCKILEEHGQCCCSCKAHIADYHHCITSPEIRIENGQCVCSIQKGWICMAPEGFAHSNWPEHSIGCEMYIKKEGIKK